MPKKQSVKNSPPLKRQFFVGVWLIFLASCHQGQDSAPWQQRYFFDFSAASDAWTPVFADYPVGQDAFHELAFAWSELPAPLQELSGVYLSGHNHSDDLLMMIKTALPPVKANTFYRLSLSMEIATNAGKNCIGIGGAPGESVYIKAGASPLEPTRLEQNGTWRTSIDLGQQANPGAYSAVLGDAASTQTDCNNTQYELKTLTLPPESAFQLQTDDTGIVWLYFLSDSGFEGKTTLYFTRASALLEEI